MKIKQENMEDSCEDPQGRRRKYRLDHLSHEEKIERKKMKNRVAAQTSRDRKKIKMDSMEMAIKVLREENEQLHERNTFLEERLKELECRLSGLEGHSVAHQSGNVLEKAMALNLLLVCTLLTVWFTTNQKSLVESLMHQTPMIPQQKAKAPERFTHNHPNHFQLIEVI